MEDRNTERGRSPSEDMDLAEEPGVETARKPERDAEKPLVATLLSTNLVGSAPISTAAELENGFRWS